ncbi:hypothetical protein K438DRAFT_1964968 [Mycena galopus ATCC 62051]|nr:hypothetical protein K438DRAFT_1964968 [Mycena galopus ATCC 62051]
MPTLILSSIPSRALPVMRILERPSPACPLPQALQTEPRSEGEATGAGDFGARKSGNPPAPPTRTASHDSKPSSGDTALAFAMAPPAPCSFVPTILSLLLLPFW